MPYKLPGHSEWWRDIIVDGVQLAELGEKTAAEVCPDVKKQLDQWLKDNPSSGWADLV